MSHHKLQQPSGRKSRKIIVVDEFDDIPEMNAVTIDGNHVQISGNRLSITGWKLPNLENHSISRRQSDDDGISRYLPRGARLFLPSEDIKNLEKADNRRGHGYSNNKGAAGSSGDNTNVYVFDDSIWTVNPDEPLLEETSYQYDRARRIFLIFFGISVILATLLLLCAYTFVFSYGGGIVHNSSISTNVTVQNIDKAHKSFNIHTLVIMTLVFTLHFENMLIFRVFPHVSKFRLKCIHAITASFGAVGVIIGLVFGTRGHALKDEPYFTSLHGCIGIMTMVLYELQFMCGISIFLLPCAPLRIRARFVPFHKFFGGMTFLTGVTSVVTGAVVIIKIFIPLKIHAQFPFQSVLLNFLGIFTVIFAMVITFLLTDHHFRRRPRPELHLAIDSDKRKIEQTKQPEEKLVGGQIQDGQVGDGVPSTMVVVETRKD